RLWSSLQARPAVVKQSWRARQRGRGAVQSKAQTEDRGPGTVICREADEPTFHKLGPAQQANRRLLRQRDRQDAAPRWARGPRHALRERVLLGSDLRAVAGQPRDGPLRPRTAVLGQRLALRWDRGRELGPSADVPGPQ